ncbi:hypothetical protein A33M_0257 [Rhodovulum sp. PH10]|uniref:DUF805 domain-containing protein n=1 Tax=Rhodovulum sp. PH10 TaxID=1187851 RepID=UPI00027C23EC|nr:DUF805 domain-containing protein [Rhodovulum sp. PH10]EJW10244.1 hypothetical protein A33M_0257 [Rhodovulum sp. PH10]
MDWRYLLFEFDGRIGRRPFWAAFVAVSTAEFACHVIAAALEGERLSAIVSLAFSYPEFAVLAKRAHDRALPTLLPGIFFGISVLIDFVFVIGAAGTPEAPSPLFMLLSVPWLVFAIALLIDLGFRRGTPGPNRYGPDPLAGVSTRRSGGWE